MAKTKIKKVFFYFKPLQKFILKNLAPLGVSLIFLLLLLSLFLPKTKSQFLKESLLRNPDSNEIKIENIEALLRENQFQAGEDLLRDISPDQKDDLNHLWQEKHLSDPEDIKELIRAWEKIIEEKPQYRDAYLQLSLLNYKIKENQKAQDNLKKALQIDPNYELAQKLAEIILP